MPIFRAGHDTRTIIFTAVHRDREKTAGFGEYRELRWKSDRRQARVRSRA